MDAFLCIPKTSVPFDTQHLTKRAEFGGVKTEKRVDARI